MYVVMYSINLYNLYALECEMYDFKNYFYLDYFFNC